MDTLVERIQGSLAGAATVLMTHLGGRLGPYQNLTEQGPATPAELAARTGCAERYLLEWLAQQASVGFLTLDPSTGRYTLPEPQAPLLSPEETPAMPRTGSWPWSSRSPSTTRSRTTLLTRSACSTTPPRPSCVSRTA